MIVTTAIAGGLFLGLAFVGLVYAIKLWRTPLSPVGAWTRFNDWLKQLASTNFKIAVGAILAVGTGLFYFGSEIRCTLYTKEFTCRPIDSTNFGLWLAFVAAWAGLSYAQFAKKRDTYASPSPDSERADVPVVPAPASPVPSPITPTPPPPSEDQDKP
jgi:hypothetical protein